MMEEISIMVAYDAHVFSQLHDEDFLTSLVAISKPRSMVVVSESCDPMDCSPPGSSFIYWYHLLEVIVWF
ncbi:hypothetical protein FD754_019687 [Muntiacus muntjak]|uniref:Uncharacterized protein n=1 Tax=Muntiacus muntjak TaxID=9888 RepID=A0A5N3V2R5_MUNMU|nr:hypothetical protein FD754_019687 [Muntiacus muntjak]